MSTTHTLRVPGYRVLQFIGSGARSTLWQIQSNQDGQMYALKRVIKRKASDSRFMEQAANEYDVGSRFQYPALRAVHNMRTVKKWLSLREIHLIMEFCDGKTVQENRPESITECVRIFKDVAGALAHMNAKGYVHADIKPNNIIVAPSGTVKVIDLGQSCPIGTVKQRIQGTPDYIAPEQVRRLPLNEKTDVYNFGASLYWTLTGRPIPTALPKENSISMVADLAVKPLEEFRPDAPKALAKLVTDCVEFQPPNRPKSMEEVLSRMTLIARTLMRSSETSIRL